MNSPQVLLRTVDLSVTFGTVRANDQLSLDVADGKLVGLIGPNGAGKTTFIDAVTGFVPVTNGTVMFAGDDITRLAAHERSRHGLARTWQSLELFTDLTVEENLLVAARRPRWSDPFVDLVRPRRAHDRGAVDQALESLGITQLARKSPNELSQGQRKIVGVARALAASPRLVLLDEPAAGLDSSESDVLAERLRGLVSAGTTMLLVDHDMRLVLGVCDEIYVVEFGRVIAHGTPEEIRTNDAVIGAYLGTHDQRTVDRFEAALDEVAPIVEPR